MKYITFAVPCYNAQDYLERCVESLLAGEDGVEIILIDDGSTDRTSEIIDDYADRYPGIVRAVHKENGGHGSGVNKGLELANGIYYKVVDSDDWLDADAYRKLLKQIKMHVREEEREHGKVLPDLYVCNYVYNHLDEGRKKCMKYGNVFPKDKICGWDEMGRFRPSQYLIMHALIYRTDLLRKMGLVLPEHTFYVDNIFACQPLPNVRYIYYMDINLYQYYLGREDQSVNEEVMMRRIDQQIKVTRIVANCVNLEALRKRLPKLETYLVRNISIMMAISSIHLLLIHDDEAFAKRKELWEEIKWLNPKLYYRLAYTTISGWTYLPGGLGARLTLWGYRVAKRIYQFQ